jgi:hypothetical protein
MSCENQETKTVHSVDNNTQSLSVPQNDGVNNTKNISNIGNYDEDINKYTKIDNLDEDPVVDSGKFFLVSFISPEGIMNCNMGGLKIRTFKNRVVFSSLEEAKIAADEINKKDKYFHVFVGETGKWMGWDPSPDDRKFVEEEKWDNVDQNELMQGMRKREETKLKELNALVGKKKDIVNKEKKTHDKRVKDALKKNAEDYKENTTDNKKETNNNEQNNNEQNNNEQNNNDNQPTIISEEQKNEEVKQLLNNAKKTHNPNLIKDRLRKKLREKEANNPPTVSIEERNNAYNEYEKSEKSKNQLDENIKKLNDILQKAKQKEEK